MKSIPDTSKWLPRKDASETLKDILYKRCLNTETLILTKFRHEQQMNLDNFDSGLGLEDILREEFGKLLPDRYFITHGVVNDRNGFTSGDHDLIIFNKNWFPYLKYGASSISRRYHFPIEGIYAIGEIKQTLTVANLDEAMKKLVVSQRLERPKTGRNRIVENMEMAGCEHGLTNFLYTFLIATDIQNKLTIDDVFLRFFEINKTLRRHELVRAICILQKATITWAFFDEKGQDIKQAMFSREDLMVPIFPILIPISDTSKSSLYSLIMSLSTHLYMSILGAEDIVVAYGNNANNEIKLPPLDKFTLFNP